jgi:tricorn protease
MRRIALIVTVWFAAASIAAATTDKPVLLQSPTLSQTGIVFVTAGDLWMVSRSGGEAKRLTAGVGIEGDPFFPPMASQALAL